MSAGRGSGVPLGLGLPVGGVLVVGLGQDLQIAYSMFISNNRPSIHLWLKENLVKDRKVSKYYETDCSSQ